jgi:hypothetical protein
MEKTITLKKRVKSKKFNVTFPSNTKLKYIVIDDGIFVEHPKHKNVYTSVSQKNIKELSD